MFKLIAKYYRMGIYSVTDVEMYVQCGAITQAQADDILTPATERKDAE